LPGVLTRRVLETALADGKLPGPALKALAHFLADPNAYLKLQKEILPQGVPEDYSVTDQWANGIYVSALRKWAEQETQRLAVDGKRGLDQASQAFDFDNSTEFDTFYGNASGASIADVPEVQRRPKINMEVARILLRHRDMLNPNGPGQPWDELMTFADIYNMVDKNRLNAKSWLSDEEWKTLSNFNIDDFMDWLFEWSKSRGNDVIAGSKLPTVALKFGKVNLDWLEQWLFASSQQQSNADIPPPPANAKPSAADVTPMTNSDYYRSLVGDTPQNQVGWDKTRWYGSLPPEGTYWDISTVLQG
jgi:hypothetical protein